jgi:predicted enzyme related to lactoylglutathione lyase
MEGKAIGIGGIFLKFQDPEGMKKWYCDTLSLEANDYGILFTYQPGEKKSYLQLGTFPDSSNYFGKKEQRCMINFRVDSMSALLKKFTEQGVKVIGEPQVYDYGTFLHIEDPEGNKIELWEPVGDSFDDEKQNDAVS